MPVHLSAYLSAETNEGENKIADAIQNQKVCGADSLANVVDVAAQTMREMNWQVRVIEPTLLSICLSKRR